MTLHYRPPVAIAVAVVTAALAGPAQEPVPLTPERARTTFAELAAACARDGGALWGIEVCGPVLLVDPTTRAAMANQADAEGRLAPDGDLFTGTLPPEVPLANAPVEWAGVRWAMVLSLFLGDTPSARVTLLAHESFHRVQPGLGLYPMAPPNEHLDSADGRYWMQLEWNALEHALRSDDGARRDAVRDALDLRAALRARFAEAPPRENALEIREGLANYTGLRLADQGDAEVAANVAARRAREDGFAHSFAYCSGPLYGYLLDRAAPAWRETLDAESDLGALLAEALELAPDAARGAEAAARHGGPELRAVEDARERERAAQRAVWRAALIDGPVLVLDLSGRVTGTVDTRKTHTLEPGVLVRTERTLQAAWGELVVRGGMVLEDARTRKAHVALAGASEDAMRGPGWTLALAPGWIVAPGERPGDRVLRPE
jgi:hypothetical protein